MLNLIKLKYTPFEKPLGRLPFEYLLLLASGFLLSGAMAKLIPVSNYVLVHTILELTCVFFSVCAFVLVWYTYHLNPPSIHVLGFGFLGLAVFDTFHTYYSFMTESSYYFDLSVKYWLFGRFLESLLIFLIMSNIFTAGINRWLGFTLTFALTAAFAAVFRLLPTGLLYKDLYSPTNFQLIFEYIIVILLALSLNSIKDKLDDKNIFTYKYIIMGLLIAIPAHLIFTLFTYNDTANYLGHLLKILYSYFLFKGIFISAIKYPYEKLAQEKQQRREILNALPLGIITYDDNCAINFVNKKGRDILELEGEDVTALSSQQSDVLFPRRQGFKDNDANGVIPCKTMKKSDINISYKALKIENGFLILFNNAKEEQELKNLQIQTQTILNSVSNLVLMVNSSNRIIMCNKAFIEAAATDINKLVGLTLEQLFKKLNLTIKSKTADRIPDSEIYSSASEASFVNLKGKRMEVLLHSSAIKNVENEIIGHIIVASDITALKEEQRKAQQQEKLALIGQLGSSIVHETKNLLASLKGYCQLISLKTTDEGIKSYSARTEDIVEEVNKVIIDFLALAKPSAPVFKELSINEMIESVRYIIESPSFIKNIRLTFNFASDEKKIMADQSHMRQLIINMAKNAVEALSDAVNPVLSIGTRYNKESNEMQLVISDNGKGMSEDVIASLGTPFFTTKETGTGLGLSLCYRVAADHNGKIAVKSKLGKGTTFIISFPLQ